MYYDYELVPLNSRKEMYDVYMLDRGKKELRCMIMKKELMAILEKQLDRDKLDVGQLEKVRLSERLLLNAAKQHY